ncbi:hypothetical protein, partial [Bacteroides sp. 51]|uniref:hypothetical protein n=1 Tax=Bacteroides sp. 51 TaxID=2302938 RepID=UPI0013D52129
MSALPVTCPTVWKCLINRLLEALTAPLEGAKLPKSKKVFDNSKVTDHTFTIATDQSSATGVDYKASDLMY